MLHLGSKKAIWELKSLPDSVRQISEMMQTLLGSQSQSEVIDDPNGNEDVVDHILNEFIDIDQQGNDNGFQYELQKYSQCIRKLEQRV